MTAVHARVQSPIKAVRIPKSDVEQAKSVPVSRLARTDNSKRFAVMGAAILEKLCRSGMLSVRSRKSTPYVLDTTRGKVALSVMVSAVTGSLVNKHMIVPITSLSAPPGVSQHVLVCAFVSKYERARETNGGVNVKLAGWATSEEVRGYSHSQSRVRTPLSVAAVPVADLHPIQTLRHYLLPPAAEKDQKTASSNNENKGENK